MAQPAWMKKLKAMNPYGSLGPSPGTVARINQQRRAPIPGAGVRPIAAPQVGPLATSTYQPNFAALVAGDPDYEAAESEFNTANLFDRGSLRDAIRRAVIESGLDVGQDEDIDAGTVAAAKANQFSSAADINNQLRKGAATSDAELAARGILSSGQFTENRGVLQKGADQGRAQLTNALLSTIQGGRNQYTQTVADRRLQLRAIKESIAARLAQNPGIWNNPNAGQGGGAGPGGGVMTTPGGQPVNPYPGSIYQPTNPGWGAAGSTAKYQASGGGPWSALYARYGTGVRAGSDPNGRPYVLVNGQKRYT